MRSRDDVLPDVRPTLRHDSRRSMLRGDRGSRDSLTAAQLREREAGRYKRHPDAAQERFFFGLVSECLDKGIITESVIRDEMAKNHVRHDAIELVKQVAA